jgi:hypothetical protein
MKIGNPIKLQISVSERRGRFVVTTGTMEMFTATRRDARRLGVVLRRTMDDPASTLTS